MEKGASLIYEWDMEEVDEASGDILDHDHRWHLYEYEGQSGYLVPKGLKRILVLVRDHWDRYGDLVNRTHAYPENGKLPERFDNNAVVPKRFRKEMESLPFRLKPGRWGDEVTFRK